MSWSSFDYSLVCVILQKDLPAKPNQKSQSVGSLQTDYSGEKIEGARIEKKEGFYGEYVVDKYGHEEKIAEKKDLGNKIEVTLENGQKVIINK